MRYHKICYWENKAVWNEDSILSVQNNLTIRFRKKGGCLFSMNKLINKY